LGLRRQKNPPSANDKDFRDVFQSEVSGERKTPTRGEKFV